MRHNPSNWLTGAVLLLHVVVLSPLAVPAATGKATSADMRPLLARLNTGVAELQRTKTSISAQTETWKQARERLLKGIEEQQRSGNGQGAEDLQVELATAYAEYLTGVQKKIDAGLGFLGDIEQVVTQIRQLDQFNPEIREQRTKAMTEFRGAALEAIKRIGDVKEARALLGGAVDLLEASQVGAGGMGSALPLDRLHEEIVGRLQLWLAWRTNVAGVRQNTRLQLVSWVIRLINDGIDATSMYELADAGMNLDVSDPFGAHGPAPFPDAGSDISADDLERRLKDLKF